MLSKCFKFQVFNELLAGNISPDEFSDHPCHPMASNAAANWLFFVDTLNFCFWSGDGSQHWEVVWKDVAYTGYFALCAAVNKAMEVNNMFLHKSNDLSFLFLMILTNIT